MKIPGATEAIWGQAGVEGGHKPAVAVPFVAAVVASAGAPAEPQQLSLSRALSRSSLFTNKTHSVHPELPSLCLLFYSSVLGASLLVFTFLCALHPL